MKTQDEAETAIQALNNMQVQGREMFVAFSKANHAAQLVRIANFAAAWLPQLVETEVIL